MTLQPGQILSDRYRIVKLLAEGGMGAVYCAWDLRLNISVALKEMVPLAGQPPILLSKLREQFSQEAMILAKLTHPHLVRVGDYFQENNNSYLVMDFMDGENLAEVIQSEGAIPELAYDGELANELLDQVYPDRSEIPTVQLGYSPVLGSWKIEATEIVRQWEETLGVNVELLPFAYQGYVETVSTNPLIFIGIGCVVPMVTLIQFTILLAVCMI